MEYWLIFNLSLKTFLYFVSTNSKKEKNTIIDYRSPRMSDETQNSFIKKKKLKDIALEINEEIIESEERDK